MKKILYLYFTFYSLQGVAVGYLPAVGGHAVAMGGCGLLAENVFSASNNQAIMPWLKKKSVGVSFQNYFNVKDINQLNLAAVIPIKNIGYGFNLYSFGNGIYRQQSVGASVAYLLHKKVSFGLGADAHAISITNYGSNTAITIQGGLVAKVNDQLKMAFHVYNPLKAKFNNYKDERLTSTYKLGLNCSINTQINIAAEIEKNNLYKPNFKTGINYAIKQKLNFRMGVNTTLPQLSFGIGFKHKNITIETASVIHQHLGVSNQISLLFTFGK